MNIVSPVYPVLNQSERKVLFQKIKKVTVYRAMKIISQQNVLIVRR